MRCKRCGAELERGVIFCRECGNRVENSQQEKRVCRKCGSELEDGVKFCSNCGERVNNAENLTRENNISNNGVPDNFSANIIDNTQQVSQNNSSTLDRAVEVVKEKLLSIWKNMDLFCKVATILTVAAIFLLIISAIIKNLFAMLISIIQIIGAVVAILMHKKIIKCERWKKYIILGGSILLTIINVMSYSWNKSGKNGTVLETAAINANVYTVKTNGTNDNPVIEKGTEYSWMSDQWTVYIATAISDSVIKIEKWDKSSSAIKTMTCSENIGVYNITDNEIGFSWIDEEHTAFTLILQDKNNSRLKKSALVVFTIDISNSNKFKGTDYDERVACYSFQNDDWHMYRLIPLTETLVKIECWSRSSSLGDFCFGWDVCIIDTDNADTDFKWLDNERTACTITMQDLQNKSYWEKPSFIAFELENKGYKYKNITEFLSQNSGEKNEISISYSADSFKKDNYKDVQSALEGEGFTNISTNILYDIFWGWTAEGEVESVSIDGIFEYEEGDVFAKDAPIIITYHMNEEDNPEKVSIASETEEIEDVQLKSDEAMVPDSEISFMYTDYKDVQLTLENAGFTNISTKILYDIFWGLTAEGAVDSVSIDGRTDYEEGDVFKKDVPIIITYHMKEEDDPANATVSAEIEEDESSVNIFESVPQNASDNLTVDNCPELAEILKKTDEFDESYSAFASKYAGRIIEFDGRIDYCINHEKYKTRFDYLVSAGDYDPDSQIGPAFTFENVAYYDLHTDLPIVSVGLNVHIVAEVVSFNSTNGLFYLDPVSVTGR